MAIQALAFSDVNDVIVPIGIKANAGELLSIGLNADFTTIPSDINIYLEDNVSNTWTLLNTSDYTFTPSSNIDISGRFYLHFGAPALSIGESDLNGLHVFAEHSSRTVIIKGQLLTETQAVLYDVRGRKILEQYLDTSLINNSIDVNTFDTGIYLVQLKNSTRTIIKKVIIR